MMHFVLLDEVVFHGVQKKKQVIQGIQIFGKQNQQVIQGIQIFGTFLVKMFPFFLVPIDQ